jgi:beta-glucosidase
MTQTEKLDMIHGVANVEKGHLTGPEYAGLIPALPRLCLPALGFVDGPAGVGDGLTGVTQLPAPEALASTWDPALAGAYGTAIGSEVRSKGASVSLGPTVNIVRDPRWGRAFESLGEDPYLTSALAVAEIDGIQSQGVMAEVKHFAVYNQETLRDSALDNAVVSTRTMEEIYLPAFEAAVSDAHVDSVMCAYSSINGTPACDNTFLLTQTLSEQWGFTGFVTSDWFATTSAASAAQAGLDVEMPDTCYFGTALPADINRGVVPESTLDNMVERVLASEFAAGIVDDPPTGNPSTVGTTPAHQFVAQYTAEEGSVLLKNAAGTLPLGPSIHSIAVIGTDATKPITGGSGSAAVDAPFTVTPLQGITERGGAGVHVTYNGGTSPSAAAAAARGADDAIVFAGVQAGEGEDLSTITLPEETNQMISAVAAANPHTIVVLNTGNPVTMPWLSQVAGVLEAWYPGEADGTAVAALLFGDVDPSGKLPVTFPTSLAQVPASTPLQWPGVLGAHYSEGLDVGYRWYDAQDLTPLFPFGFGLSYTTFGYSDLAVSPESGNGNVEVTAEVTNTGSRPGADVAQLYVTDPPIAGEPPLQLKGFERVNLNPGQSAQVSFTLTPRDLSYWDATQNRWMAPAGTFGIHVGDSSASLPLTGSYQSTSTFPTGSSTPAAPSPPPPSKAHIVAAQDGVRCPVDAALPNANAGLTLTGLG